MTALSLTNENVTGLVADVLETMCFTRAEAVACVSPSALLCARVRFRGPFSGMFWMWVSQEAGPVLAADFLGVNRSGVSEAHCAVLQLSKMLCGAIVSNFESDCSFDLAEPELTDPRNGPALASRRHFSIDGGEVTIALAVDGCSNGGD